MNDTKHDACEEALLPANAVLELGRVGSIPDELADPSAEGDHDLVVPVEAAPDLEDSLVGMLRTIHEVVERWFLGFGHLATSTSMISPLGCTSTVRIELI